MLSMPAGLRVWREPLCYDSCSTTPMLNWTRALKSPIPNALSYLYTFCSFQITHQRGRDTERGSHGSRVEHHPSKGFAALELPVCRMSNIPFASVSNSSLLGVISVWLPALSPSYAEQGGPPCPALHTAREFLHLLSGSIHRWSQTWWWYMLVADTAAAATAAMLLLPLLPLFNAGPLVQWPLSAVSLVPCDVLLSPVCLVCCGCTSKDKAKIER